MEQYNLESEINNVLNLFETTNMSDVVSILEWFYKTLDNQIIFENDKSADMLYKALISNNYHEIDSPIEELECYKRLMKKSDDNSKERVGYQLISLIMKSLKEHKRISSVLRQFIEIYNETYNKEKTYASMMNSLKECVGESVTYVVLLKGEIKLLTGILESVEEYKSVTINGERYPFVGYQVEISKITSIYGKTLYNNSHVSLSDDLSNIAIIKRKNEELFGNTYDESLKKIY